MINFRYHLVSLASIFFALAIGVALGAGPLQGQVAEGLVSQVNDGRVDEDELRAALADNQEQLDFADRYAGGTAGVVVGSALAGRTVSLIPLPGADPGDVRALGELATAAGGDVVSTISLTDKVLDPFNRTFADGLARRISEESGDDSPAEAAGTYPLLGAGFAGAFLGRSTGQQQDTAADRTEAILVEAGFVTIAADDDRRAQLALLVAGEPDADAVDGQAEIVAELATSFDAGSLGVVAAGSSAAEETAVGAVRDSGASNVVSSVDAVDLPAGRVAAVLALAEQARGGVGHYGLSGADGAVPGVRAGG